MQRLVALSLVLCFAAVGHADSDDETLLTWLKKSDLVVVATLKTSDGFVVDEVVVITHHWDVEVRDVIKGNAELQGKTIKVNVICFQERGDHHPLIKKDLECILFLKANPSGNIPPRWETANVWFGIQPASQAMTRSMIRLQQNQR